MWSLLTPLRPSSSISALVFLVLGEVTPSWSSFTRGSAKGGFRRAGSPPVELDLGRDLALEDRGSDGGLSLGRGGTKGAEEEAEEEEEGLLILETEEVRGGLELPQWSADRGLLFGAEEAEDGGRADLASCFAASRSRLYEPRLGSLYRSTVRTFP